MATQDSDIKNNEVPAERTQGSEFATDREETPSADWVQHSNEETIVYSQSDKTEGIITGKESSKNATGLKEDK